MNKREFLEEEQITFNNFLKETHLDIKIVNELIKILSIKYTMTGTSTRAVWINLLGRYIHTYMGLDAKI